jgi:energy-coupling factor transporter ATP-binding protein EcfA2
MITKLELKNFGPLEDVTWKKLGPINLVIGGNGNGKTFLLKSLYSAMRTLEEYKRGNDQRNAAEILAEKLYWTFQSEKIGDLVSKGASSNLSFRLWVDDDEFSYGFDKDTTKTISSLENHVPPRASNSIFLPAKEVLSLHNIILKSRETDKVFGFDDTYLDLARALRQSGKGGRHHEAFATTTTTTTTTTPGKGGRNQEAFAESRQNLEDMLGGRVEFDDGTGDWRFRQGKYRFPVGVTAEGVKKIAILDTLLSNRYLDLKSIVFVDELESALHPAAISKLLDIVAMLAEDGMQFILASHSYFVVKKLFLIAQEKGMSIPVLAGGTDGWRSADLKDGMPDNAIIAESIQLYEQEVNLSLK